MIACSSGWVGSRKTCFKRFNVKTTGHKLGERVIERWKLVHKWEKPDKKDIAQGFLDLPVVEFPFVRSLGLYLAWLVGSTKRLCLTAWAILMTPFDRWHYICFRIIWIRCIKILELVVQDQTNNWYVKPSTLWQSLGLLLKILRRTFFTEYFGGKIH